MAGNCYVYDQENCVQYFHVGIHCTTVLLLKTRFFYRNLEVMILVSESPYPSVQTISQVNIKLIWHVRLVDPVITLTPIPEFPRYFPEFSLLKAGKKLSEGDDELKELERPGDSGAAGKFDLVRRDTTSKYCGNLIQPVIYNTCRVNSLGNSDYFYRTFIQPLLMDLFGFSCWKPGF